MKRSRKRIASPVTAPSALMAGMSQPRLLVAVALLGAGALSVWALLPTMFVEERDEPAVRSAVTELSAPILEETALSAPEPTPEEMPYTEIDTGERHGTFATAEHAFNPDGEVDVPEAVSVRTRAPVVVLDMQLSEGRHLQPPHSRHE